MKSIKYTPKGCEEGGEFSGSVEMRVPMFDERYEILDKMGIKLDKDGMQMESFNSFSAIRKAVSASLDFYISVDIKSNEGKEYKSREDLLSSPECDNIVIDVAMALARGFRPGKN